MEILYHVFVRKFPKYTCVSTHGHFYNFHISRSEVSFDCLIGGVITVTNVRTLKGRRIMFVLAVIMAFFIYGGLNVSSVSADTDNELKITNVEVQYGGATQVLYRDSVHKGVRANGEDTSKYYTTEQNINLRDPRVFNFEFDVDAETVGDDADAFLETVKLQYGGFDLDKWGYNNLNDRGHNNNLRGSNPILIVDSKTITANADGSYTVKLAMETKNPWAVKTGSTNVPYENYGGGKQLNQFSDGQSSDNRWFWQIGPAFKGLGEYEMAAFAGDAKVASRDMDIQQYDGGHSWIQMNEFAQSLIKAINGEELPKSEIADQVTGTLAAGYVALDAEGNFVEGTRDDNVWVEVAILGYGLMDNERPENVEFNNYAKYNPIWNVVVALDESKVDTYLNETKPAMDNDPQSLIDKYSAMDAEEIDMINVFYQNNVHPDEVSGTDSEIRLITDLIDGGKAGKKINYKTWKAEDMNFRYRDPAEGYSKSEVGHTVRGGYTGRYTETDSRVNKKFDTREALDNLIFVNTICSNPDGKAGMRRTNRYAFDLNRDAVFTTMPETIALIRDIMKWDPIIEDEWHGYVQQMLIEPCTAPHDPAYDYDLLANNMRNLTYAAGMAVTASTGYNNFLVPWDHYDGGDWDDGGTIYSPMFAELLGCYGYTIEFPDSNSDSFDAGNAIIYAQVDELLHGTTEFFEGNRLNGPLPDVDGNMRDSHAVDIIDSHMKKNAILGKLMTKQRGIDNIDSMAADKYFIDKRNGTDTVVGRARPVDAEGNELSFFADYIVIPKGDLQYNIAEGIKAVNQLLGWGVKVDVSTEDVEYDGKVIPKGSFVINMNQALRNVIFEVMSKGYDATRFASMYADIYCNLPDVRGFDSIQIYGKGLFDGKTRAQAGNIVKKANISGEADDYVVFDSQSTDAVRFVNHLLANDKEVWMLSKDVEGVGAASDYMIRTKDLKELKNVKNNPVIGHNGIELYGQYVADIPKAAAPLVEPVIQFNSSRTGFSGGTLWYLLDDYLGFGSLDGYNGGSALREGANVIIANNVNQNSFQNTWVNAIKSGQAGVIFIRNAAGLSKLGVAAPTSSNTFGDVAINGTYNVDDSLYSKKYATTTTYYARGYAYSKLPEGSKVLFRSLPDGEDAFIGGFQATQGNKDRFADKVTIFSKTLDGEDFARPVDAVVFGQQMDYRSHYQKLLPMLATAIYAGAAGITDFDNTDEPAGPVGPISFSVDEDGYVNTVVPQGAVDMTVNVVKSDGRLVEVAGGTAGDELSFKTALYEGAKLLVNVETANDSFEQEFLYIEEAGTFVSLDEAAAIDAQVYIEAAEAALEEGVYTEEGAAAVQEALDTLKAAVEKEDPAELDAEEIYAAIDALEASMEAAEENATEAAAAEAIAEAEAAIAEGAYDEFGAADVQAAIDALSEALEGGDAAAISEAAENLSKAMEEAAKEKAKEDARKGKTSVFFRDRVVSATYNGAAIAFDPKDDLIIVGSGGETTFAFFSDEAGTQSIEAPVDAGTYYVQATVAEDQGYFEGSSAIVKVEILKAAQKITKVAPLKKKAKAKKQASFTLKATVEGEGAVTFKKASGNKKITVSKTGKVTVKKGLKKGTYKIKVKVAVGATANYAATSVTKTVKIILK